MDSSKSAARVYETPSAPAAEGSSGIAAGTVRSEHAPQYTAQHSSGDLINAETCPSGDDDQVSSVHLVRN